MVLNSSDILGSNYSGGEKIQHCGTYFLILKNAMKNQVISDMFLSWLKTVQQERQKGSPWLRCATKPVNENTYIENKYIEKK